MERFCGNFPQLIEKNIHSVGPKCSLPLSQQPTTCLSFQADKSNPRLAIRFL